MTIRIVGAASIANPFIHLLFYLGVLETLTHHEFNEYARQTLVKLGHAA